MNSTTALKWTQRFTALAIFAVLSGLVCVGGCTRQFFRKVADKEVFEVIKEKDVIPNAKIENFYVYPDPRARFADPTKPDRPPMPPDDGLASALAPNPQKAGRAGIARIEGRGYMEMLEIWDAENRARRRLEEQESKAGENEKDLAKTYGMGQNGSTDSDKKDKLADPTNQKPFLITMGQAVHLALINSREFQTRREDLYISALPVTLQRFAFAAQFFFTEELVRERFSQNSVSGKANRWTAASAGGFTKLFSTGALLVAQFANETVINLTGNVTPHTVSVSTINLDIVQPFLRGGGKAVTLEPLTQVERNLVYEVRDYARFRKEFYVSIAGNISVPGVGGAGGVGGGVGIASGLGVRGPQISPGSAGRLALSTGPTAGVQGYLPTLLLAANLKNEEINAQTLSELLTKFEAFVKAGRTDQLQASRVELDLLNAQSNVIDQQRRLRDALDRFKFQLGLPANVPLELDDEPIRPVIQHVDQFDLLVQQSTDLKEKLGRLFDEAEVSSIRKKLGALLPNHPLITPTKIGKEFDAKWKIWQQRTNDEQLRQELRALTLELKKLTDRKNRLEFGGEKLPTDEGKRYEQLSDNLPFGLFELALREYEKQPWQKAIDEQAKIKERITAWKSLESAIGKIVSDAADERETRLQNAWPKLPPVVVNGVDLVNDDLDTALEVGVTTALEYRLDLMNVRAQVVDAWRQVAIFANSLLGVFNIRYHFDISTPGGEAQPFGFTGSRSRQQLFLNGELPLVRKSERNAYRAALIAFQRARRALMASEDDIATTVRTQIRELRFLAKNYTIQQLSIANAYSQRENSEESYFAPQTPGRTPDAGAVAGQTQQLLQAQSAIIRARNSVYGTWISFQLTRLRLFLNLELMQIDPLGVWINDATTNTRDGSTNRERGVGNGNESDGFQLPEQLPEPAPVPAAQLGEPQ